MDKRATNDRFRSLCRKHYHKRIQGIRDIPDEAISCTKEREIIVRESDYTDLRVIEEALRLAIVAWRSEDARKPHLRTAPSPLRHFPA